VKVEAFLEFSEIRAIHRKGACPTPPDLMNGPGVDKYLEGKEHSHSITSEEQSRNYVKSDTLEEVSSISVREPAISERAQKYNIHLWSLPPFPGLGLE
jgi:hypothetical protein